MTELLDRLRAQAKEIAAAGHNGWGNTMLEAADELAAVERLQPAPQMVSDAEALTLQAVLLVESPHGESLIAVAKKLVKEHAAAYLERLQPAPKWTCHGSEVWVCCKCAVKHRDGVCCICGAAPVLQPAQTPPSDLPDTGKQAASGNFAAHWTVQQVSDELRITWEKLRAAEDAWLKADHQRESEAAHWALIFNEATPLTHAEVVERVTKLQNELARLADPPAQTPRCECLAIDGIHSEHCPARIPDADPPAQTPDRPMEDRLSEICGQTSDKEVFQPWIGPKPVATPHSDLDAWFLEQIEWFSVHEKDREAHKCLTVGLELLRAQEGKA